MSAGRRGRQEGRAMDDAPAEVKGPLSAIRMAEAIIFASSAPVTLKTLEEHLPKGSDLAAIMDALVMAYKMRGINLIKVGDAYAFRTAPDLAFLFSMAQESERKLSRAALEVLAIIAYHQPVTRAELEEIRGVETSKGTLDVLLETGWIRIRGRRQAPGRPVTYGTTQDFLDHFSLPDISDLPGMEELKGAGLLSLRLPGSFSMPAPSVHADDLTEDEKPPDDRDVERFSLLSPGGNEEE